MSRPALALIALILVAFGIVALTGSRHADPTPQEKDELEQQQQKEAQIKQAEEQKQKQQTIAAAPDRQNAFDAVKAGAVRAKLEFDGHPAMTIEMYPQAAPQTVAHFTDLIKQHFYDGILVHRVEAGFVAQAGDPASKKIKPQELSGLTSAEVGEKFHLGGGGSGKNVPLEAKLPHLQYSVGLARSQAEDSGDSQFYINLNDNGGTLDGRYCVFGRIIDGQKTADAIKIGDRIKSFTMVP